jgi:hypothetical protein
VSIAGQPGSAAGSGRRRQRIPVGNNGPFQIAFVLVEESQVFLHPCPIGVSIQSVHRGLVMHMDPRGLAKVRVTNSEIVGESVPLAEQSVELWS